MTPYFARPTNQIVYNVDSNNLHKPSHVLSDPLGNLEREARSLSDAFVAIDYIIKNGLLEVDTNKLKKVLNVVEEIGRWKKELEDKLDCNN